MRSRPGWRPGYRNRLRVRPNRHRCVMASSSAAIPRRGATESPTHAAFGLAGVSLHARFHHRNHLPSPHLPPPHLSGGYAGTKLAASRWPIRIGVSNGATTTTPATCTFRARGLGATWPIAAAPCRCLRSSMKPFSARLNTSPFCSVFSSSLLPTATLAAAISPRATSSLRVAMIPADAPHRFDLPSPPENRAMSDAAPMNASA